jgi:hypothetical protein
VVAIQYGRDNEPLACCYNPKEPMSHRSYWTLPVEWLRKLPD